MRIEISSIIWHLHGLDGGRAGVCCEEVMMAAFGVVGAWRTEVVVVRRSGRARNARMCA